MICGIIVPAIAQNKAKTTINYTVQEGENLFRIALRHKVTVAKLREWNGISESEQVNAGRVILISPPQTANTEPQATHTPEAKVTPSKIAAKPIATKTSKQRGNTHIMQTAETIAMIANTYGYTEERFREFNNLGANEQVAPGTNLKSCDCSCSAENTGNNQSDVEVQYVPTPTSAPANTTPAETPSAPKSAPKQAPKSAAANTGSSPKTDAPKSDENSAFPLSEAEKAEKEAEEKGIKDAPTSGFMSPEEMAMVDEINFVRTSPKAYVQYVEAYLKEQKDQQSTRGVEYATELIEVLNKMAPVPALATSECVYDAAKKHALEQKPKGDIDHQGKDGSMAWDRVPKACPMMTDGGECLVGGGKTVRRSVLLLLVDEGSMKRGHRSTILDPEWKFMACYKIGTVGTMKNYWIQNFGK